MNKMEIPIFAMHIKPRSFSVVFPCLTVWQVTACLHKDLLVEHRKFYLVGGRGSAGISILLLRNTLNGSCSFNFYSFTPFLRLRTYSSYYMKKANVFKQGNISSEEHSFVKNKVLQEYFTFYQPLTNHNTAP